LYNNAIIQTSYKPYVPLPKKKVNKDQEQKQQTNKEQVVTPNDYSAYNQQKSSSDTFAKSAQTLQTQKININQLLIDFNSTLNAIGASEEVENEVKTYLGLVSTQSQKENPNKKMIISNLKIAADVLDNYISETLHKPSKVVKDWVDALLLQNIDFKADSKITKGAFEAITGEQPQTAKLAEKKLAQKAQKTEETQQTDEIVTENIEILPQENSENVSQLLANSASDKIEELIESAESKRNSSPKEALNILSEAFQLAQETGDKLSTAKIYAEIASVQNELNNLPQALDCLNASTIIAYSINDNALKTQNHKQMGRIYDDAGYMSPALSHYFASLGIDGELEDTENQADTLTSVGKMYSQRYISDDAVDYYKDALELAKVTKNIDMMSTIFTNTATTFQNAGENDKALNNLKQAAILSQKSGNASNLAIIYEQAGDLMSDMNFAKRAADLYKKSYRMAEKINNKEALIRLREKLSQ